jgi:hypothetical protein
MSQPTSIYNEDFWRKDALEKLVHAAASFRLGVYSAEELEIFENRARAVLTRWGRPAIKPVPVGEGLPGEGDCDADGECWWLDPAGTDGAWYVDTYQGNYTHWLPWHALLVPSANSNDKD